MQTGVGGGVSSIFQMNFREDFPLITKLCCHRAQVRTHVCKRVIYVSPYQS